MVKLELLAPAKDLEFGKAAINHGADAVYIGASRFSARKSAGADIHEIEMLVRYAHLYNAKVYIAFNTILFDHELEDARQMILDLYHTGIDALIIQDMGILEMDLPPVPLHASTQTHNITKEKIQFLEKTGFKRAILARELSLDQIAEIKSNTTIELEAFVHGALCVSFSGQCYMSHSICNRSGNRGECAQPCRSAYNLLDAQGRIILKNKHLLSLKDLNLSDAIPDLISSGITSFKIEGRLKDLSYIRNIVSYYRKKIDDSIIGSTDYQKASVGHSVIHFTPQPEKTFNRGYTHYNLKGRIEKLSTLHTQKSLGMEVGKVIQIAGKGFRYQGQVLKSGDGLCFFNQQNELKGFQVIKTDGEITIPSNLDEIIPGTILYRNFDISFENTLKQASGERKIFVDFIVEGDSHRLHLKAIDEDFNQVVVQMNLEGEVANNQELAKNTIKAQLGKLGQSIFELRKLEINIQQFPFLSSSRINELRRETVDKLINLRMDSYQNELSVLVPNDVPYPEQHLDFKANISNKLAKKFYLRHQVKTMVPAFELDDAIHRPALMVTKHCIKYQLEACPKFYNDPIRLNEPLILENQGSRYELGFDCHNCQMLVFEDNK